MKKWYESKTVWVNLLTFLTLAAALFLPGAPFADLISPAVAQYIALGAAVVNIVLRVFFTGQPVEQSLA